MRLLKKLEHLELIYENISDLILLFSVNSNGCLILIEANPSAKKLLNLPDKFGGISLTDIIPNAFGNLISKKAYEAFLLDKRIIYQTQLISSLHPHGDWFECSLTPLYYKERNGTSLLFIAHNITTYNNRELELKHITKEFEQMFNSAADALFSFDKLGNYKRINPGFTKLFGWTEEDFKNNSFIKILPRNKKYEFEKILEQLNSGGIITNFQTQRVTKDGKLIEVLSSYSPIIEDQKVIGGIAIYKDISELKRIEGELRENDEVYHLITDNSSDLIGVVRPNGTLLYASSSYHELLGLSPDLLINKSVLSLVHPEDINKFEKALQTINGTKNLFSIEYRYLTKSGKTKWLESRGKAVLNPNGEVKQIVFITRDISEQKYREEKFLNFALHDPLTNLPNRRMFDKELNKSLKRSRRKNSLIALIMLDCDHFKEINDTYGHNVGDQVLTTFASRIKHNIRENDLASRIGGDEFQILLTEIDNEEAAILLAERIIKSMEEPIIIDHYSLMLSTSIGISFNQSGFKSKETFLNEADEALYKAKLGGRNYFRVYTSKELPK